MSNVQVCWVRVDDRLIHGQVTVAWRRYLGFDEIWVVDDGVRGDPLANAFAWQSVLCAAAPSGVQVRVHAVQEAIQALQGARFSPQAKELANALRSPKVLLLVRHPQTALALLEGGVPIPHLNVGNVAAAPGRRRAFKSTALGPEHVAALDALDAQGVRIAFQLTPDDPQADWQTVRRRIEHG